MRVRIARGLVGNARSGGVGHAAETAHSASAQSARAAERATQAAASKKTPGERRRCDEERAAH